MNAITRDFLLRNALGVGYAHFETGAVEMVPGSSPPVFVDRLSPFQSPEKIEDLQRRADFEQARKGGAAIGFGAGALTVGAIWLLVKSW